MKVTTYIANFLISKGIDTVFELQGGMITHIIDEIHRVGSTKIVSMHHEQSAAFAADAFGRIMNKPGVALATSGPGATNLITGIGSCYYDSVPAIFITGQVNRNEQKKSKATRQIGFQETEIIPMVMPITKAAISITSADEVPQALADCFRIALEGRPGPVLIDIPMDLQSAEIYDMNICESKQPSAQNEDMLDSQILEFLDELELAERPLILIGRGVRASGTVDLFHQLLKRINLPVVTSLLGFDAIEYNNPARIGFIGTYGNRWANMALGKCDLLLVLGSRLDLRQTGSDFEEFQNNKTIFHVDIDGAELNNNISGCVPIQADLKSFFASFMNLIKKSYSFGSWEKEIRKNYELKKDTEELNKIVGINPNQFLHQLSKASEKATSIVADVGNNQMWCAQSLELQLGQTFLTSGGMGAMGYALPAAIGAVTVAKSKPVLMISGDGGFQINIQELQTVKRNNFPLKMVILNNNSLGMIRQFQDAYFDSCYQSTVWGYDAPDFKLVARAYGIESFTINNPQEVQKGLQLLWQKPLEPFLLNVLIDLHTNVYPEMMYGSPISKMQSE